MDLNPLHWPSALLQLARRPATFAKNEVQWAVLALGDTRIPDRVQDLLVHGHQRFEHVPHEGPLVACPAVRPVGTPVAVPADRPAELWRGGGLPRAIALSLGAAREAALTLTAAAPGTDWGVAGSESAVVSVFVDGKYNQDVVLYGGAQATAYPLALGRLEAGEHSITLAFNQPASSPGARAVEVSSARIEAPSAGVQGLAERYQPFFYGRDDNNHSDVPLMMWCRATREGDDTVLAYAVMHSNEDGGTGADPVAEQASWGRQTDPDPIVTVVVGPTGTVKETRYVGWLDETGGFQGSYEANHPILRVARTNNSYDDRGSTHLLFRPRVKVQAFAGPSRESLMDENPWTYRISDAELRREGKLLSPSEAAAVFANSGGDRPTKVFDLRQYLYVDFSVENPGHSQIAVAVKLKGQDRWYRSDLGDPTIDPMWGGNGLRTSVPLPAGVRPADVETVRVIDEGGKSLTLEGVNKVFMLDETFQPRYLALASGQGVRLAAHRSVDLAVR
ncbi:MAG: hypothetical protein JWM80_954 [Cyanobacteria bacterium RYN_339]|nr:hypothetical protein [Cyanobacteria bacterium RYN_339]